MFLIRWIRELLSLPFLWAGRLAATFKLSMEAPLLKAAWYISQKGSTGVLALAAINRQQGPQAATFQGQSWMQRNSRPEIAAYTGLLAIDAGNLDLAKTCLQQGRQLGREKDGILDMLEFHIVARFGDADALPQLIQQFAARSDLPANLSKIMLSELLWGDLLRGQWDAAAARASHLLAVSDVPEAEAVLWALALKRGDQSAAQKHLAMVKLPTLQRDHCLCLGSAAIGDLKQARELLDDIRQINPKMAQNIEAHLLAYKVAL